MDSYSMGVYVRSHKPCSGEPCSVYPYTTTNYSAKLNREQAVDKFCLLADTSPKVPNLQKKKYGNFSIAPAEWELLGLVHEVLQVGPFMFSLAYTTGSSPVVTGRRHAMPSQLSHLKQIRRFGAQSPPSNASSRIGRR